MFNVFKVIPCPEVQKVIWLRFQEFNYLGIKGLRD
jgi:hypothetical protein